MAQIISKLFPNSANAAAAVEDIRAYRFGGDEIFTIENEPNTKLEDIAAQISQAGLPHEEAAVYAEKVNGGATLVVVHAPFGSAVKATTVLERHQPLPTPGTLLRTPVAKPFKIDNSAIVSSYFQWRTSLSDSTPLSNFLRWSTLSSYSLSRSMGWSSLLEEAAPLSKRFNWKLLLDKAAPLSERFGWSLLSSEAAPLSKRFNWSLLTNNPAPLSSFFKLSLLSLGSNSGSATNSTSTPFDWSKLSQFSLSRALGWSELSKNSTPISSRFNWRVLTSDPAPLSKRVNWNLLSNEASPFSKRLNWETLSKDPSPLSTLFNLPVLSRKP